MRLIKGVTLDDQAVREELLECLWWGKVQKYRDIDRRILGDPTAVQILMADSLAIRVTHKKCSPMNTLLGGFCILSAVPEIKRVADEMCEHLYGEQEGTPVMFSALQQSVCMTMNDVRLDMLVLASYNYFPFVLCGSAFMHFMILQQYMCKKLGRVPNSRFTIISNTLGCEEKDYLALKEQSFKPLPPCNTPMCHNDPDIWWRDVMMMATEGPVSGFETRFARKVMVPMHKAQLAIDKDQDYKKALEHIEVCEAADWKIASQEWIKAQLDGTQEG